MKIETIPCANARLSAPAAWNEQQNGECFALPVFRHETGFVSQWRPSTEELEALINGAPIWLHVFGDGHPPVSVSVAPTPISEEKQ